MFQYDVFQSRYTNFILIHYLAMNTNISNLIATNKKRTKKKKKREREKTREREGKRERKRKVKKEWVFARLNLLGLNALTGENNQSMLNVLTIPNHQTAERCKAV